MKNAPILTLITLVTAAVLLLPSRHAQALPIQAAGVPPSTSECLQKCFDQFIHNLKDCKKACFHCSFSFLGICIVGGQNEECLDSCTGFAKKVQKICMAECTPPKP